MTGEFFFFTFYCSLLVTSVAYEIGATLQGKQLQESAKIIRENLGLYGSRSNGLKSSDLCGNGYSCCDITSTESCDIDSMTPNESTLVFPGGDTRCIYSTSTPYAFQVIPGAMDKVMVYFQGGGACWDRISDRLGFCTTDITPQGPYGIFDREDVQNAFADFTIIHALYCSGGKSRICALSLC